eukprot:CAMPEP_0182881372 /NCGR_PEP_ID=MMETSP0034_2-20130328/17141_1 /TAXON_ID=156128 /ORGANISM="Nephroselmis pyriformis, Strain CCMP717" /LENGTH=220 /DNA_ID=CAMNT_0025014401 /DNA_START=41 /DNA_END=700 /DNA_ORIENTATION=-
MGGCFSSDYASSDMLAAASSLGVGLLESAKHFPVIAVIADLFLRVYKASEDARTLKSDTLDFASHVRTVEHILVVHAKELQRMASGAPLASMEATLRDAAEFLANFAERKIFFSRDLAILLCSTRDGNQFSSLLQRLQLDLSSLNLALSAESSRQLTGLGDAAERGLSQSREIDRLVEEAGGLDSLLADEELLGRAGALMDAGDRLQLAAIREVQVTARG